MKQSKELSGDLKQEQKKPQDKIFRRKKRLSTSANFVHAYLEIWDTGILKFNKLSKQ